jgi:dipeptide transport system ATP-binding protein
MNSPPTVLRAEGLVRHYPVGGGWMRPGGLVKALDGVSFELAAGRSIGIVGESGCGKSTLARVLTRIEPPTAGRLWVDAAAGQQRAPPVQMVFQNPFASLNPRKTIEAALSEPLLINTPLSADQRHERVRQMLTQVGLRPEHAERYPHMFSGGQRQRVAIARAMMLKPAVVVADEPTSALDVSVQAQILNLFADLQAAHGTAYVFISHNLAVVEHVAHEVLVMYLGRAVEQGPAERVLKQPRHPYTRALKSAVPAFGGHAQRVRLRGELPSPLAPPGGCAFHTRCPLRARLPAADQSRCSTEAPALRPIDGRAVACHFADEAEATAVG